MPHTPQRLAALRDAFKRVEEAESQLRTARDELQGFNDEFQAAQAKLRAQPTDANLQTEAQRAQSNLEGAIRKEQTAERHLLRERATLSLLLENGGESKRPMLAYAGAAAVFFTLAVVLAAASIYSEKLWTV